MKFEERYNNILIQSDDFLQQKTHRFFDAEKLAYLCANLFERENIPQLSKSSLPLFLHSRESLSPSPISSHPHFEKRERNEDVSWTRPCQQSVHIHYYYYMEPPHTASTLTLQHGQQHQFRCLSYIINILVIHTFQSLHQHSIKFCNLITHTHFSLHTFNNNFQII